MHIWVIGWFEVFLDRRLNQDDNRGLQQGVTDNRETPAYFRIVLEERSNQFKVKSWCGLTYTHPIIFNLLKNGT